ncbi:MAG: hypothetical protein GAK37_00528 [Pseudomonas sp.]|nr:MAG: hypothetical protein GAK37_00528 [Pseudomonas sp.]
MVPQVKRFRTYTFLLALTLALSGCASWFADDAPAPEVSLVKVEATRVKLLDQKFKLYFRVDNRSEDELIVRGLIYKVYLGSLLLTEGESSDWLKVPAKGHAFFKVSVRTNLWPQVRDVVEMLKNPDQPVPYRLTGALKTGLLMGNDVQVAHNGEIIPGSFIPERHK